LCFGSLIKNFHGVRQELDYLDAFDLDADEPPLLLGQDIGPNPVGYDLTALAACVTSVLVYHAAALLSATGTAVV